MSPRAHGELGLHHNARPQMSLHTKRTLHTRARGHGARGKSTTHRRTRTSRRRFPGFFAFSVRLHPVWSPTTIMGCAESKDAPAKPVERKPAAATPSQPKEQSAPSKPPPTAPEVAVPAQSPPSAPLPALASSLKKPATFNAGIYATSTDRRIQEVEFFRNIVKQTEEYVSVCECVCELSRRASRWRPGLACWLWCPPHDCTRCLVSFAAASWRCTRTASHFAVFLCVTVFVCE